MGLPVSEPLNQLASGCPGVRLDTVGVGGTSPLALRFEAPGVIVRAIQSRHDAYEDTLHRAEPADLWAMKGDRLRFADGRAIATRVAALREVDSVGVVVIDRGDDGTGSFVSLCRYPYLAFIVGNDWPSHKDAREAIPLSEIRAQDTTSIARVETTSRDYAPLIAKACRAGAG